MVLLRRRTGPVVGIRGNEEPDPHAATGSRCDPQDGRAVGDVRVDDVERFPRVVEQTF